MILKGFTLLHQQFQGTIILMVGLTYRVYIYTYVYIYIMTWVLPKPLHYSESWNNHEGQQRARPTQIVMIIYPAMTSPTCRSQALPVREWFLLCKPEELAMRQEWPWPLLLKKGFNTGRSCVASSRQTQQTLQLFAVFMMLHAFFGSHPALFLWCELITESGLARTTIKKLTGQISPTIPSHGVVSWGQESMQRDVPDSIHHGFDACQRCLVVPKIWWYLRFDVSLAAGSYIELPSLPWNWQDAPSSGLAQVLDFWESDFAWISFHTFIWGQLAELFNILI